MRQALLVFLQISLLVPALGCTESAGPVQRVSIDPATVSRLVVKGTAGEGVPCVINDADVIGRCVRELNGLAYEGSRPPLGLRVGEELVLEGKDEKKIAGFGFAPDLRIRVFLPDSEPFYIRWQPLPTVSRLSSYRDYALGRERLVQIANDANWDKETGFLVGMCVRSIARTRPDLDWKTKQSLEAVRKMVQTLPRSRPGSAETTRQNPDLERAKILEEVRRLVEMLPEATLDNLDQYADSFK
ncbi:MAG: hypothetical protein IMZ44_02915 [Planctomycetes bacterium]|nr:hypothetical protein [Planctomycetota bacterium]